MKKLRQKGFTLIELMVSMGIVIVFATYFMGDLASVFSFKAKIDTENKLKAWKVGMESVYLENSFSIESSTAASLLMADTSVVPPTAVSATNVCSIVPANIVKFATRAGLSPTDLALDGGKQSFCMFITPRVSSTIEGSTISYHFIGIISAGGNGIIDTGTSLSNVGTLTLAGDDMGIVFDGRKFASDRYTRTITNLNRVIDAYNAYYAARYQADATRSLSTDYFSCGTSTCPSTVARWDNSGEMMGTCSGAIPMVATTGPSPHSILGLSNSDVVDGWGGVFNLDNCSNNVRSPANTATARALPPYTATVSASLPGGSTITMTSVGKI